MMISLRSYQKDILNKCLCSIDNNINPIVQLDTGAGKTPIVAGLCGHFDNFIVIAHRNFLVTQASATLSKMNVDHDVMASKHTRNLCVVLSLKYNKNVIYSNNRLVASVDTLLSRKKRALLNLDTNKKWIIIIDEAHHALDDNKWGSLKNVLPNAVFVGFTATPVRMDGRSLNSESGGLFDCIIQSDELKENSVATLIASNYLSDFKCYVNEVSGTDEFYNKVNQQYDNSLIFGDYIKSYSRLAKNKRAIVMCRSILEAEKIAHEFKISGYSAACISSKMSQTEITRFIEEFKLGIVKILCNVAMIDEGFDDPSAECLIMLRATNFRTYRQWVGRVLRPKNTPAIIIDHADNILKHGLPDDKINWCLFKDESYKRQLIDCKECGRVFHISKLKCPDCGHELDISEEVERSKNSNPARKIIIAKLKEYKKAEEDKIKAIKIKESYKHELQIPWINHSGLLGKSIEKFSIWFCDSLKSEIGKAINYEYINLFMNENFNDKNFWVNNFTANELSKPNKAKCLEIYKKYGGKL